MMKSALFFSIALIAQASWSMHTITLHQAPLDALKGFSFLNQSKGSTPLLSQTNPVKNSLKRISQTEDDTQRITRYQQLYQGVLVVGAHVILTRGFDEAQGLVNGELIEDIDLNTTPRLSKNQALDLAKKSYFSTNPQMKIEDEQSELQIRMDSIDKPQLVYLVSFKGILEHNKPVWPFFIVDAQTGIINNEWNNIKTYSDVGPGGNEKVHQYWYGKEGLPALEVTRNGSFCVMDDDQVRLVHLSYLWDWENRYTSPYQYPCGNNTAENINGGFSPTNDAYFFGHTIVAMYHDWYGMNALEHKDGSPMKLMMRVHFGRGYDNAFWDGQSMSFGDGDTFYPLVSLDVAGHEVTHGFTEQHSNLEYHDQSGALNEAVSDMAGQATRAYLLEKTPALYNKMYLKPNEVTWGIGETIVRDSFGGALRFMDFPSNDGSSADCLDKEVAQQHGVFCGISYDEVVAFASAHTPNPQNAQNYIVHTGSGVFNKAFYLLSKEIGIKTAYHLMVIANTQYWTPNTDFKEGACGVIKAAQDLNLDTLPVRGVFGQVGIDTGECVL